MDEKPLIKYETRMLSASAEEEVRSELSPGEILLWSGRPRGGLLLRGQDWMGVPFSAFFLGFAIFWERGVLSLPKVPFVFVLWGVALILAGAYLFLVRFFVDAWIRARTAYGVTSERLLIVSGIFARQVKSFALSALGEINLRERANGVGTLTFGAWTPFHMFQVMAWPGMRDVLPPCFEQIDDARKVQDLIRQAQRERKF